MNKPAWHLSGTPYPVQVEAMKRSKGKKRYGLWVDMGLGKTALTLNMWIEDFSDYDTAVVICPNSFRRGWTKAPAEWGLTSITTSMWPDDEMRAGRPGAPHLNAINFEAIRSSGYDHIKKLMDAHKCLLIVDESSFIKNFKSQTARAVLDLSKRTDAVRLLNGTPLVQNVLDLYPQLKCIGAISGVNPYAFRNRYAIMGGFLGKQIVGVKHETELHAIQSQVSFRATKKDWWEGCPEKIFTPLHLEMLPKQRRHYKEMMDDFFTLVAGHEFSASMVISQLEKLRQVSSGVLLDGDRCEFLMPIDQNPKVRAVLDLMEAGATKLIVVHFYRGMGLALEEFYKKRGFNPAFIRGQMKPDDVEDQKAKFNDDPKSRILVAQITASSMSHTLVGGDGDDRCNRMFFHDGTFNLRDRMQMEDRIHRGKQDRNCLYFEPVLSPVDLAQQTALLKKTDLVATVVDAVRALRKT